jgi:hypothetical protein
VPCRASTLSFCRAPLSVPVVVSTKSFRSTPVTGVLNVIVKSAVGPIGGSVPTRVMLMASAPAENFATTLSHPPTEVITSVAGPGSKSTVFHFARTSSLRDKPSEAKRPLRRCS